MKTIVARWFGQLFWRIKMKSFLVLLLVVSASVVACGATFSWEYVDVVNGSISMGGHTLDVYNYKIGGDIYGEIRYPRQGGTEGDFIGYWSDGAFYLKQQDQMTTPMPFENNQWFLAFASDIINVSTIQSLEKILLTDWNDISKEGGTLIGDPSHFYLAFMTVDISAETGDPWCGWLELSVNQKGEMSLLNSDIGLYGETLYVGGAVPEPSGSLLVLVGLSLLGLKRRRKIGYGNSVC